MADQTLDTSGLACPLPILKTKKAMRTLASGQTLEVLATDPGAPADVKAFCQATGHTLVETAKQNGTYRFIIRHQ